MTTGGIVLAAGNSRRMGSPKALLPWGGGTLLEAWIAAFRAARADPIVVVCASMEVAERGRAAGARVVLNPDPSATGPGESLLLGAQDLLGGERPPGALWFTPVDVPPPSPATLEAIRHALEARPQAAAAVPVAFGRPGHPVLARPAFVASLGAQVPPRADRALASLAGSVIRVDVPDAAVVGNLNAPADVAAWRRRADPAP